MPKLVFDTKKIVSSYAPIEFEIDGKTYVFKKQATTEFMVEMDSWRLKEIQGDMEATARQLMMITGMTIKEAMKIDQRVIVDIIKGWADQIVYAEKKLVEEKKVEGLGEKTL